MRPAGPVWLALRADLRLRWRAVLGLALLLGLIGGVVLTAAAGARRTDTAYPRLLRWSHAASVQVVPTCVGLGGFYRGLAHLPQVASIWTGVVYTFALPPPAPPGSQLEAVASPDGALGTATDRVRVLAGRPFDPADPRAVMVDQELAAAAHVQPGGTLRLLGVPSTPKTCAARGGPATPGRLRPVPLSFRVSAVVAFDDQVVPSPGLSGAPRVLLSPGFWRSGAGREFGPGDYAGVRLRPGVSLASFRRAVAALARRDPSAGRISVVSLAPQVTATQQAARPQVVSLAVFAALTGLIGLAILAQLLGRQLVLDSVGFPTLRALGMTRRSLAALSLARVTTVTVPAACLAVAVAIAASPLMPIGPARLAEPSPGVEANLALLGAGLAAIALLPVALLVPVAWRAAARAGRPLDATGAPGRPRRGPPLTLAGSVTEGIGARMAFQPGYGRTAVPVRSSLIATTAAVMAVIAAGVFGASFIRLTSTPHRYGQNWSEQLNLQFGGIPAAEVRTALAAQPGVTGYAAGDYGQVSIGGQAIPAIGLDPLHGRGFLTLLAGRAPATGAEIALGEGTLRSLHLRLGQRVPVGAGRRARPMKIVGVATFARFSQASSAATDLGTGAVVPAAVLSLPSPPTCAGRVTCYNFVLIRYRHGTSLRAAAARLAATVTRAGCPPGICLLTADQRPGEIRNYAGVRDTPVALGLVLVALAVGTLAQVLLTSVRRRRRDLAVLKTLGLSRRQVQAVVAWQAVALTSAALALGLPLGLLAGRWAWAVFAGSAGVAGDASVPPPLLLLAIPAALLAAVLIAAGPGWAAARTSPAAVLRAE
jgi:ABC-type antimicrobial peptide transport system permease subunit